MPLPTYRDAIGPEAIDTTYTDTGSAKTAQMLGNLFSRFSGATASIGAERAARLGETAGQQAGASGDPQYKEGFMAYTAYGKAYNNAATRSYAVKAEADAESTAARLEVDSANNPQTFQATFSAVRDATIKAAPVQARGVLADMYNRRMTEGLARITRAQATEVHQQNRDTLQEGLSQLTDRIGQLRSAGDPAQMEVADAEHARLQLLIDGAASDGTVSAVEAQALRKNAEEQIAVSAVTSQFDSVLEDPHGNAVHFLQALHDANKSSDTLSPDAEKKLEQSLYSRLVEHNRLQALAGEAADQQQEKQWQEGEKVTTEDWFAGKLTLGMLAQRVQSGDLKPSTARVFAESVKGAGAGADDEHERLLVSLSLDNYTEQEILSDRGLKDSTKRELIEKKRKLESDVAISPQAKEGLRRLRARVGIQDGVPTPFTSQKTAQALATAQQSYYDQLSALPPEERAKQALTISEQVQNKYLADQTESKLNNATKILQNYQRVLADPNATTDERRKAERDLPLQQEKVNRLTKELSDRQRGAQ